MKRSSLITTNSVIFGVLLFLLSFKGAGSSDVGEGFILKIELPILFIRMGEIVNYMAAIVIGVYVILSLISRLKIKYPKELIYYQALLSYYFFSSMLWGSGEIENFVAVLIMIAIVPGVLNIINIINTPNNAFIIPTWTYSLNLFAFSFVILNICIYFLGYGYPELGHSRFFGPCYHPNTLGAMAAICLGILISQTWNLRSKWKKTFPILIACGAFFITIISGSRSSMLMLSVAILSLSNSAKSFVYILMACILLGSSTYLFKLQENSSILQAIERMSTAPTENRSEVWQSLWRDFLENPLLGVGDGTGVSGNAYLTAFAGTGIFGGLLFIIITLITAIKAIRIIQHKSKKEIKDSQLLAPSIIILQIIVGAQFEASIFDRLSPISLITIFCIAVINSKIPNEKRIFQQRKAAKIYSQSLP